MRDSHKVVRLLFLLVVSALVLAACGSSEEPTPPPAPTRTPRPTFTPTPVQAVMQPQVVDTPTPAAQPAPQEQPAAPVDTPTPEPSPTPVPQQAVAVVNAPVANTRLGPSTTHPLAGQVQRGTELQIQGKNPAGDWWQVCCVNGQTVWIAAFLVDTTGPVDAVAVAANIPTPPPAPTPTPAPPTPTPAPAQPTPTPAPAYSFDLILAEQFPEPNVVRIWLYVFSDSELALGGYSLKVTQNGVEHPINAQSHGGQPDQTWPVQSPRTRFANMKVELNVPPGGTWVLQLVDGAGNPVGPPAEFQLSNNDQEREMYVRYKRR